MADTDNRPIATGTKTFFGRELFLDPKSKEPFSEKTRTVPFGDGFVVIPSVNESGIQLSDKVLENLVRKSGPIDPVTGALLPVFESIPEADKYARSRSEAIAFDLRQRQRPQERARIEPVVVARGSVSETPRGNFGAFGEGRASRTQAQGQLGVDVGLPGNVRLRAGTDAVYSKDKFTLPPDFVKAAKGFGFNVPREVVSGTRGVDFPAQTVEAQFPVGRGGIASLMGRVMRSPRGDVDKKMFRAGLKVPIPVQGGILGALFPNR